MSQTNTQRIRKTFRLKPQTVAYIDRLADATNRTRQGVIDNMVEEKCAAETAATPQSEVATC